MSNIIFIAGDSTAAIKANDKRPETGWAEKLQKFCSSKYVVKDLAFNGASTKTFLKKGILDDIDKEINAGDYLIIQFGHNDQKVEDPNWGTTISEYKQNLTKFINTAKKHNAIPIVLSSIIRRRYENGKLVNTLGEYPKAAKNCAQENDVLFIDMNKVTFDYVKPLTPDKSKTLWLNVDHSDNYPKGVHDNTHLNDHGATVVANLVAKEIKKLSTPLSKEIIIN